MGAAGGARIESCVVRRGGSGRSAQGVFVAGRRQCGFARAVPRLGRPNATAAAAAAAAALPFAAAAVCAAEGVSGAAASAAANPQRRRFARREVGFAGGEGGFAPVRVPLPRQLPRELHNHPQGRESAIKPGATAQRAPVSCGSRNTHAVSRQPYFITWASASSRNAKPRASTSASRSGKHGPTPARPLAASVSSAAAVLLLALPALLLPALLLLLLALPLLLLLPLLLALPLLIALLLPLLPLWRSSPSKAATVGRSARAWVRSVLTKAANASL